MKAKVIETGEIIEVKSLYSPIYSRLDCNGKIISEYDEDELEFLSNPDKPKMVSLDKVCEYLKTLKFQAYPGATPERLLDDGDIDTLRKEFE
jgi:hypothetical protein